MLRVYALPVLDKVLIYAPLHNLTALVNRAAAHSLAAGLKGEMEIQSQMKVLFEVLHTDGHDPPEPRQGPLTRPLFLGLIPTRGCNLACRYCDFVAGRDSRITMPLSLVRQALETYVDLLERGDTHLINVHFFGGEPFYAAEVVQFAVASATRLAGSHTMGTHFEVTTNGVYHPNLAGWIADQFDSVVLSLDGPEEIQERQRPAQNGHPVFPRIFHNAKIFSEGACELILRVCVTQANVKKIPEIAVWMASEFKPTTVCFETVHPTPQAMQAGLQAPDPYEFADQFHRAAQVLETEGINPILSTADMSECQSSLCPVGKDALIVSPDGVVDACYLPEGVWQAAGLDMRLGKINAGKLELDSSAIEHVRNLSVENQPGCAACFCQYHCAGGCHVRHNGRAEMGPYDPDCVQTRLVTISNLLRSLDQNTMATDLLTDHLAMEIAAFQTSDLLFNQE
jgi:radical SAM protein with 4Fe4S-binding SPASM domain